MTEGRGRVAGRCATHDDLAWLHPSGFVGCMHQLIVEGDGAGCWWVPMPRAWLPPGSNVGKVHLAGLKGWSWCGHQRNEECQAATIEDSNCLSCERSFVRWQQEETYRQWLARQANP